MRTHFTSFLVLLPVLVAANSNNLEYPTVARRQQRHRNARAGKLNPVAESPKRTDIEARGISHVAWPGYELIDKWEGENFFDNWTFFNTSDPTHGLVNYLNQSEATALGLAYIEKNGKAVMKADSTSDLAYGVHRNSVRITTNKAYNHGLFILDAEKFPYGCGVWPAWWMVGPNWPNNGEIDIFEGVNLNNKNQYTAHTAANCSINSNPVSKSYSVPNASATLGLTDCGPSPSNSGCDFLDADTNSYGAGLNAGGGAVLAMEWTSGGLKIWNFPRGQVPLDIILGVPVPDLWGKTHLKGGWESSTCDADTYFRNMSIVFDITLCGDWAGGSGVYASSGCPGNCTTQVMTGSNFANALWEVNSVKVYQKESNGWFWNWPL
ncbi:hypothetical protein DL93DRAFT_2061169 [Clavulina sp. PMI_390]|nr:hypothetical protein DL93DRAFT_2061169 [Clavulina sp. PMI_390]